MSGWCSSMKKLLFAFLGIFTSCLPAEKSDKTIRLNEETKQELLTLEIKWLEAEFKLDTAYISTLIDSTFTGISGDRITNKQEELKGMFHTINAMRKDSVFLDSLKLEDGRVKLYENVAVVTFIVHTYKKDKGLPIEKRTRFYDVWVNRNGKWKAVAAQGTVVE
jgi:hypothetical protein